jgi:methyl-accepting chemotaxis protein
MLENIKIRNRILLGYGVILVVFVVIGIFILNKVNALSTLASELYDHPLTVSNGIREIEADVIRIHRDMKDIALSEDAKSVPRLVEAVGAREKKVQRAFALIGERFLGDKSKIDALRVKFTGWRSIRQEVIRLAGENRWKEAAAITQGRGAAYVADLEFHFQAVIDFANRKAAEFLAKAKGERRKSVIWVALLLFLSMAAAILVTLYVTLSITRPLNTAMEVASKITAGNLSVRVDEKSGANDELGRLLIALENMAAKLRNQIQGLIPICSNCKKIRDDEGYWQQVEQYISKHSDASFTHGYCPTCLEALSFRRPVNLNKKTG